MQHGLIREERVTANGRTIGENCREFRDRGRSTSSVRLSARSRTSAGFLVLRGNLFDSAIMKTSVISDEFRERYLSNPDDPDAFEGPAVVFDGPEDYHARIDDPSLDITLTTLLFMRGAGPIGYPGGAEVVNMRRAGLPDHGRCPCCFRASATGGSPVRSGSPSILNASPEAAAMGGLALLRTGDRVRIDLKRGTCDVLVGDEELEARRRMLEAAGGYKYPRFTDALAGNPAKR